jgi:hypothetical protein
MSAKILASLLAAALIASTHLAAAQQLKKVLRIGYLVGGDFTSEASRSEGVRLALRELGSSKERTSHSSTDMRRVSAIASLSLQPSWCVLRSVSSW